MFWVICDRLAKGEIVLLHHSDEYCKIKYVQCSGYHLINCHCLHKQPSVFHSPSLSSWLSVPLLHAPAFLSRRSKWSRTHFNAFLSCRIKTASKKNAFTFDRFPAIRSTGKKKRKEKKTWVLNRNYIRMLIRKATGGWQKHRSSKLNGLKKIKFCVIWHLEI